mmetsp:Transcript_15182/g.49818  ORF Transcript_15182/g.49818 Transcript_15182/m.49818 type:complete len:171 (-) Transcript_15182:71-583(-)|eukprot:CAMPEP_0170141004 /NCGR_PEP_ID=MMETSP0033_2-20121228/6725_1 /TAXON_ID=195969 /ORGANISM="Dolichomastix tenuilepis, Strain CCMP3274" /LENGTH=170 /DNA_ID=CAMNT_0010377245 /DNA_START=158 /DNA_END=670 /DNA_ORIENTATION=+
MDLHHILRRPAGASIHGCNICGKEGHHSAACPNGTVDWGSKWPKEMFKIPDRFEGTFFVDCAAIKEAAKEYAAKAKEREEKAARVAAGEAVEEAAPAGAKRPRDEGDGAGDHEAPPPAAKAAKAEEGGSDEPPGGPESWMTYFDHLQRPYYYHTPTGTTVWVKPKALEGV